MELIVVRHGKAEPGSPTGRDEDRPLAAKGERQSRWLGEQFRARGFRPGILLASRFTRARETARILQPFLHATATLTPVLEVGEPVSGAVALITAHAAQAPVMIVGHNPQLSELIWVLTRGLPAEDAGLKTGQAVRIEMDPRSWEGSGREIERLRMDSDD